MSSKVSFSHIAEIVMGQSPKGEEVNNKGIGLPLLNGPTEFTDRYPMPVQHTTHAKKTSQPGDILFCVRGSTTGRMNYSDQKYCIGRGLAAVRGRNGYPTPYVKAILETYLPELLAAATGSTFPNVSKDLINNISVEVLPVENACNINKLIKSQEEKIFNNNQINQTLEQMAQALFKSWFVDFEPVKAKITVLEAGGSQEKATLAAMTAISGKGADSLAIFELEQPEKYAELKTTAELFPSAMQDSELGNIPEGWEVCNIKSSVTELRRGISPKYTEEADGITVINQKCIRNHTINFSLARLHDAKKRNISGRELQIGDVLVNSTGTGTLGRLAPIRYIEETIIADSHITVVRADTTKISNSYLSGLLMQYEQYIESNGSGSTGQTELRKEILEEINFPCPPLILGQLFEKIASCLNKKFSLLEKQIVVISNLRDTLLPKLLSGEITLPEAEHAVSEVANV